MTGHCFPGRWEVLPSETWPSLPLQVLPTQPAWAGGPHVPKTTGALLTPPHICPRPGAWVQEGLAVAFPGTCSFEQGNGCPPVAFSLILVQPEQEPPGTLASPLPKLLSAPRSLRPQALSESDQTAAVGPVGVGAWGVASVGAARDPGLHTGRPKSIL